MSSQQDPRIAVEAAVQAAEARRHAAVYNLTVAAAEHHRAAAAQLVAEAIRAFEYQAKGHVEATEKVE